MPPSAAPSDESWIESTDIDDLAAQLGLTVRAALRKAAVGLRKVAVAVGGLDSSGLLALLRAELPDLPIVALSFDIEDPSPDLPFVRELCAFLGVDLHVVRTDDPEFDRCLVMDHRPFPMFGGVTERMLLRGAADAGADALFYGHMGDDLFGGHLPSLGSARLLRHPVRAVRCALDVEYPIPLGRGLRVRSFLLAPLAQRFAPRMIRVARAQRSLRRKFPWLTAKAWAVVQQSVDGLIDDTCRPVGEPRDLIAWRTSGVDALDHADLRRQLEVSTGVRALDPLLDPECIAFASRIPPETLSADGRYRGLFRRALSGLVPERVRLRRTKGDGRPERRRLNRLAGTIIRPYRTLPRLSRLGLVDGAVFDRVMSRADGTELHLWPFIAAEAFLERAGS